MVLRHSYLFASWSQPPHLDIGISTIAILEIGALGVGAVGEIRTLNQLITRQLLYH